MTPLFFSFFHVKVGTYWWHGHVDTMSRADGVFGGFVVKDPNVPLVYDEERWVFFQSTMPHTYIYAFPPFTFG